MSQASGVSSGNSKASGSVYEAAHAAAAPQAGPIYQKLYDRYGGEIKLLTSLAVKAEWVVQKGSKPPQVIQTLP